MIEVKLEKNKHRVKLSVSGHAQENKDHSEICASASILLYTIAQNIKDMKELGYFGEKSIRVHVADGNGVISFPCRRKPDFKEILALRTVLVICRGYEILAHNFPEDVSYCSSVNDIS